MTLILETGEKKQMEKINTTGERDEADEREVVIYESIDEGHRATIQSAVHQQPGE